MFSITRTRSILDHLFSNNYKIYIMDPLKWLLETQISIDMIRN